MPEISLTMFPALNGDSFLVSINERHPINLLVDTGYKSTYASYLKPKLLQLRELGQSLDLLVITHIDSDHIAGALKLLNENKYGCELDVIKINHIWHNSYRHLRSHKSSSYEVVKGYRDKSCIRQIMMQGYEKNEQDSNDNGDISAEQGSSLARLIYENKYLWNEHFSGQAVSIDSLKEVKISENVKLIILSPSQEKLDKLKSYWTDELYNKGYIGKAFDNKFFDDAFEYICSRELEPLSRDIDNNISDEIINIGALSQEVFVEDTRLANGSSISFVLEYFDLKLLFLGDSHPSLIESSLKIHYNKSYIWFDAIKVSHHGSKNNTSPSLLGLIDSDSYFISTNGRKHNHPDLTTIARIINRPASTTRRIYFNYPNKAYNALNSNELKHSFNYSVHLCDGETPIVFHNNEGVT